MLLRLLRGLGFYLICGYPTFLSSYRGKGVSGGGVITMRDAGLYIIDTLL